MSWRIGPGPVFRVEMIAAARRWQTYALRAGIVLILFAALLLVWMSDWRFSNSRSHVTLNDHAALGTEFTNAILGTQLALVLLVAPAATAGAICIDKARGNLLLLMATDISNAEIVFGKLFARFMPVFALVVASLPVLFIASLLGGISGEMLITGFATIIATAIVCCAVALAISLHVGKTHEALLLTYLLIVAWLLSYWFACLLPLAGATLRWIAMLNPFVILYAPMDVRLGATADNYWTFIGWTLGVASIATLFTSWRVRRVVVNQSGRRSQARGPSRLAGPRWQRMLNHAPMRWYERHRKRPSRATKVIWGLYIVAAVGGAMAYFFLVLMVANGRWIRYAEFGPMMNAAQVGVGLLMVTVNAVTALADERTRGSLDVLMTTPVPTRAIVAAKWRTAFSLVPKLLIVPIINVLIMHFFAEKFSFSNPPSSDQYVMAFALTILHPLACGAMLTSLGLLVATCMEKFGRAVGLAVTCYVLLAIGWIFLIVVTSPGGNEESIALIQFSPIVAQGFLAACLEMGIGRELEAGLIGASFSIVIYVVLAAVMYAMALRLFDQHLGRIPESGLRRRKAPTKLIGI